MLIEAMKKANSADPAKYLPVLAKMEYAGSTGKIAFDDKGDRKDAEMTIFTMKAGKLEPIAVVKAGKSMTFADFMKGSAGAMQPTAMAPAKEEMKKDDMKKDDMKKDAMKK